MKKVFGLILAVLLAFSCLAFTACADGIVGDYKLYYMEEDGERREVGVVDDGGGAITEDYITLKVNADGSIVFNTMGYMLTGTWAKAVDAYVFTMPAPDDPEELHGVAVTLKDGILTAQMDEDVTYAFRKK